MPTYILMTKLDPTVLQDPRGRRIVGTEWRKLVHKLCPDVRWISHYALLGQYDFMDIYEAADDTEAHRVSLISRSTGAVTAESWSAIPYDRFLEMAEAVDAEIDRG